LFGAGLTEDIVPKTDVANLEVITVGKIPNNPAELLGSSHMLTLLQETRKQYRRIVIDSPVLCKNSFASSRHPICIVVIE
jgi:succinoglycan biosynthesis transport protein ExoP